MADANQGAALLLNEAGNIDRARTTDGSIFRIESTLSMEAAEEAKTAAANCNTATESAEAAEKTRVSNENARKTAETERGNNETTRKNNETSRKNAETTRQDNETARKNAGTTRRADRTPRSNAKRPKASAMTSISPTNRHRATRPLRRTARLRVRTQRRTRRCRSPTPLRKAAQEARTSRSCVPRTRSSQRFWRTRQVSSYTWAEQSTARLQRHRRAG